MSTKFEGRAPRRSAHPRAAGSGSGNRPAPAVAAGRDPAGKRFRVRGTDIATGKKVTVLTETDPATGSTITGIDEVSGRTVSLKVDGRDPAG